MALLSRDEVGDEDLEKDWKCIGNGGFGRVYKTRNKKLGLDVAIKLVHHGAGSILPQETSLYEEASLMDKASFKFVLMVYGIYKGSPPVPRLAMQEGIVMEFMERGSIETLQETLSGPPPWSLAFRLAHQVALGMNFLHSKNLVHQDLKPSNVLLNDDLNAKLADFGLSRISTSALKSNQETQNLIGGTFKYMPPEAFELSYKPVRSFDIYSYGILLWSIFSGKEPYPGADIRLVELRIPRGDRPPHEELDKQQVEGLKELLDLMKCCWDGDSSRRPPFSDILKDTERAFKKHKGRVRNDVTKVLNILDLQASSYHSQPSGAASFTPATPGQSVPDDVVDHPRLAAQQTSVSVCTKVLTEEEKAKFVDANMSVIVQDATAVKAIADELKSKGMVHNEAYSIILRKESDQDKVREIYEKPLRSGGDEVKAAFYDALKTHEPRLMKRLDG